MKLTLGFLAAAATLLSVTSAAAASSSSCLFGTDTAFLFLDTLNLTISLIPTSTFKTTWLNNTQDLLSAVRGVQQGDVTKNQPRLPLIAFSQLGYTPGYPEISPNNFYFSAAASLYDVTFGSPLINFWPTLVPNVAGGELVVYKGRFNAALGNSLTRALESQSIKKVVLSGISTSGVILSTATFLSDLDYAVYVVDETVIDPLDFTAQATPVSIFNGTTLSQTILYDVLADYIHPISLDATKAALCPSQ